MKQKPLVSIIIPVYNVEKYLSQCLDSVLNQTYTDIEIICVNDGSNDGSGEILNDYVARDNRIKIINIENQGLSNARNVGFQHSKGEYVVYIDSDDWVDANTIEVALNAALERNADVVLWNYIKEYTDLSVPVRVFEENREYKGSGFVQLYRQLVGLTGKMLRKPAQCDSISTAWGKLYKASIIKNNNIQFVDTQIIGTEDLLFNAEYFRFCESAVSLSDMFNHYRKQNSESLARRYKPRLYEQWAELQRRLYLVCGDKVFLAESLSNRVALSFIGLGINEMLSPLSLRTKYKKLKMILSTQEYKKALASLDLTFMPIHWKIFFISARCRLMLSVLLLLYAMTLITGKN